MIQVCGTDNGPCVFPFNYDGTSYSKCTTIDHDQPWCATGETVTATVKPVEQVKVRQSRNDFFKSLVLPINELTNLTLLL